MDIDPSTTKYVIKTRLSADGVVEKPDVVGAIFGQTEGLLGDELDLRDLQKSGRMGRIEVEVSSSKGKSSGTIIIPSSLDLVETSILAAALETIDRVGPCKAKIIVEEIRDVRESKRKQIVERAKELLSEVVEQGEVPLSNLSESVRAEVQMEEITDYGDKKLPAGPNVKNSDAIIVVEGRSDVLNLLKYGIKNAVAVEGTNIPDSIKNLSSERVTTAFVDGDRGGSLILKELLETAEIDYVAQAPDNTEVEELTQKQLIKSLRNKIPIDQYIEMYDLEPGKRGKREKKKGKKQRKEEHKKEEPKKEKQKEATLSDRYKDMLDEIKGEKVALLLNGNKDVIDKVATGDLSETLNSSMTTPIDEVVFDGIITQRLVDAASDAGVKTLIARRVGNIPKLPTSIKLISMDDL
ncbi:MAG: DNA primase DnaG [Thermoplasmata archaeon]